MDAPQGCAQGPLLFSPRNARDFYGFLHCLALFVFCPLVENARQQQQHQLKPIKDRTY